MSAALPLPPDGDQNRGPALIAIFWVMTVVVINTLALRFYSRIRIREIGADDWMMLFTAVSAPLLIFFQSCS